jgi:hypothetical protein
LTVLLKGHAFALGFLTPEVDTILRISFCYLARISEVLALRRSMALPGDRIVVPGVKHSSAFLIYLPGLCAFLDGLSSVFGDFPIFSTPYSVVYRQALKAGIVYHRAGGSHNVVTHAARHLYAKDVSLVFGLPVAGDLLHHKSRVTIKRYAKGVDRVSI